MVRQGRAGVESDGFARDEGGVTRGADVYSALLERSADGVLLARTDGTILRANPAACRILGRSEEELRRLGRQGLVVPGPRVDDLLSERARTGSARGEVLFRRADGSAFPVEITSALLTSGERLSFVIFREVPAERSAPGELRRDAERGAADADREEELRGGATLHRAAFALAPVALLVLDPGGRILAFSDEAHRQLGYGPEAFARLSISDLAGERGIGEVRDHLQRVLATGDAEVELRQRTSSGGSRDVLVRSRRVEIGGEERIVSAWLPRRRNPAEQGVGRSG
jgi:PAS domain S-box-containing protein